MASKADATYIITRTAEETQRFATELGCQLLPGDVIALIGDLGAGKTTFTQGLAVGLKIPSDVVVNSPTFTILAEHTEGRTPLYHFDVYRLCGPDDLYDLAFDEYLDAGGVVVVEWADRIEIALPDDTLRVELHAAELGHGDIGREIRLLGCGPRSTALVASMREHRAAFTNGEEG